MTKEYPWMLGPFEKAAEANPCLVPNAASRFFCPIQEKEIGWKPKMYSIPLPLSKTTAFICSTVQKITKENMQEPLASVWQSATTGAFYHHAGARPVSRKGRIFRL